MEAATRRRRRLDLLVRMALAVRGGTRRDLAELVGRDPSNIIGCTGLPKIDVAWGLVQALGWRAEHFLEFLLVDEVAAKPSHPGTGDDRRPAASDMDRVLQELASLQLDGWCDRVGVRTLEVLQHAGRPWSSAHFDWMILVLAASRLWSGLPLEALALLGLGRTGAEQSLGVGGTRQGTEVGDGTGDGGRMEPTMSESGARSSQRPDRRGRAAHGRRDDGATEDGRSPVAEALDALARVELAQRGLVPAVNARRAIALALQRCTDEALTRHEKVLRAAGLRPGRIRPALEGILAALPLLEGVGSPQQVLDRCRAQFGPAEDGNLVRCTFEALTALHAILRPPVAGERAKVVQRRALPTVPTGSVAAVLDLLRDAVEVLDEWPLRRRWLELERVRRTSWSDPIASHAEGGHSWPLGQGDLALIAGVIARYPQDAAALLPVLSGGRIALLAEYSRRGRSA